MKVTTVRFGPDLWALLEGEAARAGTSVSQYIREAALARAAFAAGTRAGVPGRLLGEWAQAGLGSIAGPDDGGSTQRLIAALARAQSVEEREEAAALRAESRQARRRAVDVRAERGG